MDSFSQQYLCSREQQQRAYCCGGKQSQQLHLEHCQKAGSMTVTNDSPRQSLLYPRLLGTSLGGHVLRFQRDCPCLSPTDWRCARYRDCNHPAWTPRWLDFNRRRCATSSELVHSCFGSTTASRRYSTNLASKMNLDPSMPRLRSLQVQSASRRPNKMEAVPAHLPRSPVREFQTPESARRNRTIVAATSISQQT